MTLPQDLLEQAEHLARREKKRPKQASLRRSVSASYYALFHLLTADAVATFAPNMTPGARQTMARWFDHGEMKRACTYFTSAVAPAKDKAPKQLASILAAPVSVDLQSLALAFIRLQEARHDADYNLMRAWTRLTAQQHIAIAKNAFAAWATLKKTHEANVFALALFSAKVFDRER